MKIPKKLKVGPMLYDILYPHRFIEDGILCGLHDGPKSVIKISDREDDTDMHVLCLAETLLHEIIHAVDFVFCGQGMEEVFVEKMSEHLLQTILDNDLDFYDNKIIPKKLKVGGYIYSIKYQHIFEDTRESLSSSINKTNLTVYLADSENHKKFSNRFVKLNLFYVMLCCILRLRSFTAEEVSSINLKTFAAALFEVFVDNKLMELIKNAEKETVETFDKKRKRRVHKSGPGGS
jgi:hypothetical protein